MGWRFIILTECMLSVVWFDSCNLQFKPWIGWVHAPLAPLRAAVLLPIDVEGDP